MSQGWAIAHKLPEASSPKAPGTCCHPSKAPASRRSLPKPSIHFTGLVLHTRLLPRAHLDLSRGKKPLYGTMGCTVHSAITSGNLQGMTKATFLLTHLLLSCSPAPAGKPGLTIPSWSRVSADITGFLLMHRPGSYPSSLTSSCAPLAYQFAKL